MPIVTMPDGANVSFPDTLPPEQIKGLIAQKFPEVAQPASPTDSLMLNGDNAPRQGGAFGPLSGQPQPGFGAYNAVERGMGGAALGLTQLLNTGNQNIDQQTLADTIKNVNQAGVGTGTSGLIGEMAGDPRNYALALGGPLGLMVRATQGALYGASQGSESPDTNQQLQDRGISAGANAAGFGILPPILGAAVKGVGKTVGAIAGKIPQGAQDLMDLGKQFGVNLRGGDFGDKTTKSIQDVLDEVPFIGTVKSAQQQESQLAGAATNLSAGLKSQMNDLSNKSLPEIQAIAKNNKSPYAKAAQNLINEIQNSGDDWNAIIQNSGNAKALVVKNKASGLYDKVDQLAGEEAIPTTKTLSTIDSLIKQEGRSPSPDKGLITYLTGIGDRLSVKPNWKGSTKDAADTTYTGLRDFRSRIGSDIADASKGANSVVTSKSAVPLQQVKNAVEEDMANYIKTSGNTKLQKAAETADSFYKNQVVPYKDRRLANALNESSRTDEIYSQFIQRGAKQGRAQQFYNALNPDGQAAVRYGLVNNAIEKSTTSEGNFDAAQFSKFLNDHSKAAGVFFKGGDKAQLDGLTKLMQATTPNEGVGIGSQIGKYLDRRMVGTAVIGGGLAGGAFATVPTAAVMGSTFAFSKLLTTAAGRRILLSANLLEPKSLAMQKLIQRASTYVAAGTVKRATQDKKAVAQ